MKYYIKTFGCQMNVYDSQRIARILQNMGHTPAASPAEAGLIIFNTCHIREKAAEKLFSDLGRINLIKEERKAAGLETIIGVVGCVVQAEDGEIARRAPFVNFATGPLTYYRIPEILQKIARDKDLCIIDTEFTAESKFDHLPENRSEGACSYLAVQEGCNNFCTYCIIPYARGRVRSLPVEQALEQTARLADAGVHEIVLTGIEIASYGKDFEPQVPLTELLEKLLTAQPNVQFRLGSLDPRAVDDVFCERLAGFANLARHFHLSMQSGCDTVLRRMNRHYTSEEFYRCVERLRRAFPDCSVTTDLIVGFPGETGDEFTQTLAFLERCAFASVHVFPYSVREGTKAAAMPGQLDQQTKTARAERAKQVAETLSTAYRKQFVGRTLYALPEHPTGGLWAAHGRYGFPVYIEDKAEKNHPVTVKVIGLHKDGVLAKIEN